MTFGLCENAAAASKPRPQTHANFTAYLYPVPAMGPDSSAGTMASVIPLRDNEIKQHAPIVTWTIIALNCLIFAWDRHGHILGDQLAFADLTMRPQEVVMALHGTGDRFPLVTVFTAMFLHGNLSHLLGNMVFLYVFGSGVEEAFGGARMALYYLFWGVAAAATQIYSDPGSMIPTLGASGAIGGVLGAYLLLFPGNKIEIVFPIFFFFTTVVSAWVLLGAWFVWQIVAPQQGVANWAHVGGFLAGMLTVLILGGRQAILGARLRQFDYDF